MNRFILALATAAAWAAVPAAAQDLGQFRDWWAHRFTEEGSHVCTMWSQPEKAEGKYTRRGEIFALVSHRPADKQTGVVWFEMGYPFASGKKLSVSIDGGQAGSPPRQQQHCGARFAESQPRARAEDAVRQQDGGYRPLAARDQDDRYLFALGIHRKLQGHLQGLPHPVERGRGSARGVVRAHPVRRPIMLVVRAVFGRVFKRMKR